LPYRFTTRCPKSDKQRALHQKINSGAMPLHTGLSSAKPPISDNEKTERSPIYWVLRTFAGTIQWGGLRVLLLLSTPIYVGDGPWRYLWAKAAGLAPLGVYSLIPFFCPTSWGRPVSRRHQLTIMETLTYQPTAQQDPIIRVIKSPE